MVLDWLPGVIWVDVAAAEVAGRIGPGNCICVVLPAGVDGGDAIDAVAAVLRSGQEADVVRLSAVERPEELLAALASEMGSNGTGDGDPDRWLLEHAHLLEWPRIILAPMLDENDLTGERMFSYASTVAQASRDLSGPIAFVLFQRRVPSRADWLMWPGSHVAPAPLPYWKSHRGLVGRGFETYLSLRAYWEGAGRPAHLRLFADIHRQVPRWTSAADTDLLIDACFDRVHATAARGPDQVWTLFNELHPEEQKAISTTGVVRGRPGDVLDRLETAGVVWKPAGSPRAYVTASAAYSLAQSDRFVASVSDGTEGVARIRRLARRNELLASWVLELCGQVEREVRNRLIGRPETDAAVTRLALQERLEQERDRQDRHLAREREQNLLEFATLSELLALVRHSESHQHLPVTVQQLDQVRRVRNLAAHLHSVSWFGIERVLAALETLTS